MFTCVQTAHFEASGECGADTDAAREHKRVASSTQHLKARQRLPSFQSPARDIVSIQRMTTAIIGAVFSVVTRPGSKRRQTCA